MTGPAGWRTLACCALLVLAVSVGCSKGTDDPLGPLAEKYDQYPEYSVVLQDMDVRGVFFKARYHIYQVIVGEQEEGQEALAFRSEQTPWIEVSSGFYKKYEPMLGMVVLSKGGDGQVSKDNYPPGYQYIGNERYGQWRSDNQGGSFWEFYGKYALFTSILGMGTRPIHRWDYDRYSSYRGTSRPYFGPSGNYYGTRGTYTKQTNPTFFQRQQAREQSRKSSFSDKARDRSGTSRSRSRTTRSGK